ncbi:MULTISPECIES: biotin transporter BioY [Rhizobium]|uniref:Biotin transporter n=1 Tax=Rhizobium grahamii CCGE 502 TaxID=990285 RepID=S3HLA4_9HYPH|nr:MULTISPECIES: biotin transporter BioY [Rhizobium]EPE99424.1 transmembrane biotin biosynthesis protein [Rhizobium grahamii CCGE 502]MBB3314717.1 biotin transport system substrate-specific component [Rhizobium sp. BK181]MBB3539998.1 biotin transport system substrate-specific component [Rhizobium sp. BK399]MCS3738992.1 biotin transport system substrate-specific component [Rhizobium sp. BK661]MCS4090683.1 biotin transport system substrate-specific component [Rhizobium sp. BK176]
MSTRDLVLSALFAAIIVALGILPPITLGFIPVPITAQSLGVMMAGVVLGARRGTIAVLIVLVLVAIGLPVLSGGRGGLAAFAAPTTGFLIGWVLAAFVTGYLSERLVKSEQSALVQTVGFFLAAMIGGIVVLYACGIVYLAFAAQLGLSKAFLGSMAFIPGDVVKAFVAALVGRAVMVGYPLLPVRS